MSVLHEAVARSGRERYQFAIRRCTPAGAATPAVLGARIFLQVWQEAPRAIAFYRRTGFAVIGETIFRFGERIDRDFVMVRARRTLAARPDEAH